MSAEIIRFGGSNPTVPNVAARLERATTVTREPVSFSFKGESYQLIFRGGEWRLVRLYYRIQNGRRVTCKHAVRYPDPELLSAAERHEAGEPDKSKEAAQAPEAGTPSTPQPDEPDAKTVELITRVDALKKIMTYASQQLKAGRMPQDVMDAFAMYFAP